MKPGAVPAGSRGWALLTVLCLLLLGAVLSGFFSAERRYDRAAAARQQAHVLMGELRQYSDDLARAALTHALTRDGRLKQIYREILPIRDGQQPPVGCDGELYWTLLIGDEPRCARPGRGPIFDGLRDLGLAPSETLALKKLRSGLDELTRLESAAMSLAERADNETGRENALGMLTSTRYNLMKYNASKLISDLGESVDLRARNTQHQARVASRLCLLLALLLGSLTAWSAQRLWLSRRDADARSPAAAPVAADGEAAVDPPVSAQYRAISSKVSRRILIAAALCTLFIGGVMTGIALGWVRSGVESDIRSIAMLTRSSLEHDIWDIEPGSLKNQIAQIYQHHAVGYVRLRVNLGYVFEQGDPGLLEGGQTQTFDIFAPNTKDVIARLDIAPDINKLHQMVGYTVGLTLLVLVVLTLLIYWQVVITLKRQLEVPLRKVAHFVTSLSPSTLTRPLVLGRPGARQQDEIDLVVDGFSLLQKTIGEHIAQLDQLVAVRTAALQEANAKLQTLSEFDALTGIANRRKFDQVWGEEINRAVRQQLPLAVMLIDVDHFKGYNDHYGHQQGDDCLRRVAQVLAGDGRRHNDLVARYGGEEFVVVLPGEDEAGALVLAESMRRAVQDSAIPHEQSSTAPVVTICVGIACGIPHSLEQAASMLGFADRQLYSAKRAGRNRVALVSLSAAMGA